MSEHNPTMLTLSESWASAFIDGETTLVEHAGWSQTVHEQLYYYTVTRQVLQQSASASAVPPQDCHDGLDGRRALWLKVWARVDAA